MFPVCTGMWPDAHGSRAGAPIKPPAARPCGVNRGAHPSRHSFVPVGAAVGMLVARGPAVVAVPGRHFGDLYRLPVAAPNLRVPTPNSSFIRVHQRFVSLTTPSGHSRLRCSNIRSRRMDAPGFGAPAPAKPRSDPTGAALMARAARSHTATAPSDPAPSRTAPPATAPVAC